MAHIMQSVRYINIPHYRYTRKSKIVYIRKLNLSNNNYGQF